MFARFPSVLKRVHSLRLVRQRFLHFVYLVILGLTCSAFSTVSHYYCYIPERQSRSSTRQQLMENPCHQAFTSDGATLPPPPGNPNLGSEQNLTTPLTNLCPFRKSGVQPEGER